MPRCPNCFRETMRTTDWACYLCGYPLASPGFKLVEKTYSQIREERLSGKKPAAQEEREEDHNCREYSVFTEEMEDVPLVSSHNTYREVDTSRDEENVIDENISPQQVLIQKVSEHEEDNDSESVSDEEIIKELNNTEQKEMSEEPEESECGVETVENVSEVAEDKNTANAELGNNTDDVLLTEKEQSMESAEEAEQIIPDKSVQAMPETAITEEPAQTEKELIAPADINVTIDELLADYAADYTSATEKFVNRTIRLSGYAGAIDVKEVLAINYIRITDASLNLTKSVQCMFDKKHADELKSMGKGQQVTVQGKYTGSLIAMRMSDCVLVIS
ncbi:MAG TPA: hypothetical protein DCR59_00220 [Dehalococcoidia bacterium]|nr:hypothetical protein [Dehalococcoidia bacterium]